MTINPKRQGEQPQDDRNNAAGNRQGGSGQSAGQPLPQDAEEKPADQLSPEELRLMADTMPGDGPGDD